MKKTLNSILTLLLAALPLVSCGGDSDSDGGSNPGGNPGGKVIIPNRNLAFPGADGGASTITGGAGGSVYTVTSLEDNGTAGTLRDALNHTGVKTIVFAVGGTIYLKSPLRITNGDVTIAGQTAPGGGITIAQCPVLITASNVIIRYVRFRLGDIGLDKSDETKDLFNADDGDALGTNKCEKVMIDHCSVSWSTDECASFKNTKNLTVQYCIISESLKESFHDKGNHGYGGIWGGSNASYHHNLLANHDSRNPRFSHSYLEEASMRGPIDYVNNVVFNWGGNSTYGGESAVQNAVFHINMIGNYYKPGLNTSAKTRLMQLTTHCTNCVSNTGEAYPAKIYLEGNYVNGVAANWDNVIMDGNAETRNKTDLKASAKLNSRWTSGLTALTFTESANDAYTTVLTYAGASKVRDVVDERIILQVKNGTGALINSQTEVGGYPTLEKGTALTDSDGDGIPDEWEKANGLEANNYSDGAKYSLTEKYSNLEVYLNELVTSTFPAGAGADKTR
jgi:hypothetical protein